MPIKGHQFPDPIQSEENPFTYEVDKYAYLESSDRKWYPVKILSVEKEGCVVQWMACEKKERFLLYENMMITDQVPPETLRASWVDDEYYTNKYVNGQMNPSLVSNAAPQDPVPKSSRTPNKTRKRRSNNENSASAKKKKKPKKSKVAEEKSQASSTAVLMFEGEAILWEALSAEDNKYYPIQIVRMWKEERQKWLRINWAGFPKEADEDHPEKDLVYRKLTKPELAIHVGRPK